MVTVDRETISASYANFVRMFYSEEAPSKSAGRGLEFWAFLGVVDGPSMERYDDGWGLPDKAAHYAALLAGPHYRAIAKMMILNGHDHTKPIKDKWPEDE